jgi:hypothetical protein
VLYLLAKNRPTVSAIATCNNAFNLAKKRCRFSPARSQ